MASISAIIPTFSNTSGLSLLLEQLKNEKISQIVVVDNAPNKEKKKLIDTYSSSHKIVYLPQEKKPWLRGSCK